MEKNKRHSYFSLLLPLLLALPFPFTLMNCARESAPMGGPTDSIAPFAVVEKPQNNSQGISPKKIVIKFNEFIELENVDDNCMIAPIMEERPDISVKKKKIYIDLSKQNLSPNTTYSFNFSNTIKDLTEGNVTDQYVYAFSTGSGIDTMKIAGSVSYAINGKIPEKAFVLLYDNLSDTAFQTQKPRYITQISKEGKFEFSNIEAKPYKIYVLEDADKDFTFNQVTEKIAFLDTIFTPSAERFIDTVWFTHNDTIRFEEFEDSIQITAVKDSFNLVEKTRWSDQDVKLSAFSNEVWTQEILSCKRISRFAIGLSMAAKNNFPETITFSPSGSFNVEQIDDDSLMVWLNDTILQFADSLQMFVHYKENLQAEKIITDTFQIEIAKELPDRLCLTSSTEKNSKVYSGDSITMTLSRPLQLKKDNAVKLYASCDTSRNSCNEIISKTDYAYKPKKYYQRQEITKYKEANDRFALYFSKPINSNNVTVTLDGLPNLQNWYTCELDERSNALLFWITNDDALRLKNQAITVKYTDEGGQIIEKNYNQKKEVPVQKMYRTPTTHRRLVLRMSDLQKTIKKGEPIRIYCNNPIATLTDSLFSLVAIDDSLETSVITKIAMHNGSSRIIELFFDANATSYSLNISKGAIIDTFGVASRELTEEITIDADNKTFVQSIPFDIQGNDRTFTITADWQENTNYTLVVPDSTFIDVYGDGNDSISYQFQSPKKDGVGNLIVKNTQGFPSHQLVFIAESSETKEPVQYVATMQSGQIIFKNLPAGMYALRCFIDENGNGKWDTGCIEIKRQPEKIYFFKDAVSVKAEWDNSIFWEEF